MDLSNGKLYSNFGFGVVDKNYKSEFGTIKFDLDAGYSVYTLEKYLRNSIDINIKPFIKESRKEICVGIDINSTLNDLVDKFISNSEDINTKLRNIQLFSLNYEITKYQNLEENIFNTKIKNNSTVYILADISIIFSSKLKSDCITVY